MAAAPLQAYFKTSKDARLAVGTYSLDCGVVNLHVSAAHASHPNGGVSENSLSVGIEKPDSFLIKYVVPNSDVRFKFKNSFKVSDKTLNLSYSHNVRNNQTALDGSLVLNSANKLSGFYAFDSGDSELKYSYVHKKSTTIEPSYDFGNKSFNFSVKRFDGAQTVRASYKSSSKVLGMDWSKYSGPNGIFKVSASVNLGEELKFPKITAESIWDIDMTSTDENTCDIKMSN